MPSSFATLAIGRDVSITIFTASSLNSGEKLFFGRGKTSPFQIVHLIGWTVRKARGTSSRWWRGFFRVVSRPMLRLRETRRDVARVDRLAILQKLTDEALVLQEIRPVLDPEITQEEIKRKVEEQASQILGDAETDYANFESARALAEGRLGRTDYLSWGICGVLGGYILATALFAKPRPLYGLTAIVATALSLVIVVRWGFLRSRRERLFQGLETARERWIDRLRNQALLPFILQTLNDLARDSALYATSLNPDIPPRLVERSEPRRLVASEAMDRIRAITESMREGSLGV